MRINALSQKETMMFNVLLVVHKYLLAPHTLTSRVFGIFPMKAGLQTFLHSQAPSHPNE